MKTQTLAALEFAATLTEQLSAAPDSLQSLAERDPAVRNWLANERGLILSAEAAARKALEDSTPDALAIEAAKARELLESVKGVTFTGDAARLALRLSALVALIPSAK